MGSIPAFAHPSICLSHHFLGENLEFFCEPHFIRTVASKNTWCTPAPWSCGHLFWKMNGHHAAPRHLIPCFCWPFFASFYMLFRKSRVPTQLVIMPHIDDWSAQQYMSKNFISENFARRHISKMCIFLWFSLILCKTRACGHTALGVRHPIPFKLSSIMPDKYPVQRRPANTRCHISSKYGVVIVSCPLQRLKPVALRISPKIWSYICAKWLHFRANVEVKVLCLWKYGTQLSFRWRSIH